MHSNEQVEQGNFWLERALLPGGWARDVRISVLHGRISGICVDAALRPGDVRVAVGIPGLCNLHSHAFQRGMAGLSEVGGRSGDSFWTWRQLMYQFSGRLDPDSFQAIAGQAYVEMLESGFTRVGEFHYLHNGVDGKPYADRGEMATRIVAAADDSGIGLTLLPVFYAHSDFGGEPANPHQVRLVSDLEGFCALLDSSDRAIAALDDAVLGVAPHSLRAVTLNELTQLLQLHTGPIHIHIAEQLREVDACLAWSGRRPVEWLFENVEVNERWCLVHATHVNEQELRKVAESGAVVGLCPITEGNLGDGLFSIRNFTAANGRFGIGSDSNVLIDPAEELRWLEYGQRLHSQERNVLVADGDMSSGRFLFEGAMRGGAQALGVAAGLQVGASADIVSLDTKHPALACRSEDRLLDSWVFAVRSGAVDSVWRRGRKLVSGGHHMRKEIIARNFHQALSRLLGA